MLVVFSPIFVAAEKKISRCDFVAPLAILISSSFFHYQFLVLSDMEKHWLQAVSSLAVNQQQKTFTLNLGLKKGTKKYSNNICRE